ncbi:MAG TPA: TlyA family RNA methyltransferase [Spirochaetota bacterium]|jgi:23S rRNA (cytidine1920-2'-O)/16S rRNA (cytidine1409-2'-O)-methyltransferase|nr:MAG: Hemolysin A [Spirochaetes bacterium ADurb.Bin133]HNZ26084.1 TlyA family RNA methyltransferase [Spirochaetota bacterium]HPY86745.1 TlyA family RNA methyltransferase [Spirochaetota bacterium]
MKKNIVKLLVSKFNLSEKEAAGLTLSGRALVNDVPITKTGTLVDESSDIRIKQKSKFVSRASLKLIGALEEFNINPDSFICLDIGSSTGGFTDVLLDKGASKVICVDSGSNQLHYKLRTDKRVTVFENIRIQDVKIGDIGVAVDLAVMDVSFASATPIVIYVTKELGIKETLALVKPQFEYERLREILEFDGNFNGVVADIDEREKIVAYVSNELLQSGVKIAGVKESKIKGAKGNVEYFFHIKN